MRVRSANRRDEAPKQGVRQLATRAAARALWHQPRWFWRNLRQGPEFLRDRRRQTGVEPFRQLAQPEAEAAAAVLKIGVEDYRSAVSRLWMPEPDPDEPLNVWSAREGLLRIVGVAVMTTKPRVVVETGVALGFTTATTLRAMEDNGIGMLHSIDLPAIQYDPERPVGAVVPDDLRSRWDLRLGDSRALLGPLCAEVAPIDIFVHDALHTYSSQLREYRTVWPYLRSGGILISDDVENPALVEFAAAVDVVPRIVLCPSRLGPAGESAIGMLRKP